MSTDAKSTCGRWQGLRPHRNFKSSSVFAGPSGQRVVADGAGHGEEGGAVGVADIGSADGFGFAAALGFFFGAGLLATGGGLLTGGAIIISAYTGFGVMRGVGVCPVFGSLPSSDNVMRTGTVCGWYPLSVNVVVNSLAATDSAHGVLQV